MAIVVCVSLVGVASGVWLSNLGRCASLPYVLGSRLTGQTQRLSKTQERVTILFFCSTSIRPAGRTQYILGSFDGLLKVASALLSLLKTEKYTWHLEKPFVSNPKLG